MQWKQNRVEFVPTYLFRVNSPSGERRVIAGRGFSNNNSHQNREVTMHPLLIDPVRKSVEVSPGVLQTAARSPILAAEDYAYIIEPTGFKPRSVEPQTSSLVRINMSLERERIATGLPVADHISAALLREGRFEYLNLVMQPPPERGVSLRAECEWWSVSLDGKDIRCIASKLPQIGSIQPTAHHGLIAILLTNGISEVRAIEFPPKP